MNIAFIGIVLYLILQMGIAIYASRLIKSESDFLVAGRSLGVMLATFSLFATWFGAETVVASSGAIASEGLSGARVEPFGYAICLLLFGFLLASRIREGRYLTYSDFYKARFGLLSEKISVVVIVLSSLTWAGAQVVALSHIMASIGGIEYDFSLIMCTVFVIAYTTVGGFLGDVITDCVQTVFIIIGLVITAFFVVSAMGGLAPSLEVITMDRLNIISPNISMMSQSDEWAIAILGSLISQEAVSRVLGTKSPEIAKKACYLAAGLYLLVGGIPAFIALTGGSLIPMPEDADAFLPALAKEILPTWAYVLFLGALVSAILSTINSTLLSAGGLTGHNLVIPLMSDLNEDDKIRMERIMVIIAGFVTYLIASMGDSVYELIEISSSFGSAGLLVCLLFGLWTRMGGALTSLLTMVIGVLTSALYQYVWEWDGAYIASILTCVIVYLAAAPLEQRLKPMTFDTAIT